MRNLFAGIVSVCLVGFLAVGCNRLQSLTDSTPSGSGGTISNGSVGAPQGLNSKTLNDALQVSWSGVAGVAGYQIYYKQGSTSTYNSMVDAGSATHFDFINLVNNTAYNFLVQAYANSSDGKNFGAFSTVLVVQWQDSTGPDGPTNFMAVSTHNVTGYFVKLSWKNPTNRDFQGIRILRKVGTAQVPPNAPANETDGTQINLAGPTESYNDDIQTYLGLPITYRIYAYDRNGNFSLTGVSPSASPPILIN